MKTQTVILCEVSGEPIGNRVGVVVEGTICRFDPEAEDGIGEVLIKTGGEPAAFLSTEFLKLVSPPKKPRQPRDTGANAVKAVDVQAVLAKADQPLSASDIGAQLGKSPNAVREVLRTLEAAGQAALQGRGRYVAMTIKHDGGVSA